MLHGAGSDVECSFSLHEKVSMSKVSMSKVSISKVSISKVSISKVSISKVEPFLLSSASSSSLFSLFCSAFAALISPSFFDRPALFHMSCSDFPALFFALLSLF
jgi:hypothetical protein